MEKSQLCRNLTRASTEPHPEVVCAVHRGLISGALEELGSEPRGNALEVFVDPNFCIARLGTRPGRD